MDCQARKWLGEALAWMALPVVPVVLESIHYDVVNLSFDGHGGPDPFNWDWFKWVTLLGPVLGFGFLAGATLGLPDEPGERGWRGRRAVWVAVGPWAGLLAWGAVVLVVMFVNMTLPQLADLPLGPWWNTHAPDWLRSAAWIAFIVFLVATLCYSWLWPAVAALRRARRRQQLGPALRRGVVVMLGFVGSLLGSFWAIAQAWRSYFFDRAIVPVLLAGLALTALSGCGAPVTYGEVRRRELFQALLVSWTFGLALLWRWWGRPRSRT